MTTTIQTATGVQPVTPTKPDFRAGLVLVAAMMVGTGMIQAPVGTTLLTAYPVRVPTRITPTDRQLRRAAGSALSVPAGNPAGCDHSHLLRADHRSLRRWMSLGPRPDPQAVLTGRNSLRPSSLAG